jgi:hypothetical protein
MPSYNICGVHSKGFVRSEKWVFPWNTWENTQECSFNEADGYYSWQEIKRSDWEKTYIRQAHHFFEWKDESGKTVHTNDVSLPY